VTPKKPKKINIMGVDYTIEYVKNPAEVDLHKRRSLWGQIDYWTRTIRIYDNGRPLTDIWVTIIHEVFHAIAEEMKLKSWDKEEAHEDLDRMASIFVDVAVRNKWFRFE
jgi:hypothetical protein